MYSINLHFTISKWLLPCPLRFAISLVICSRTAPKYTNLTLFGSIMVWVHGGDLQMHFTFFSNEFDFELQWGGVSSRFHVLSISLQDTRVRRRQGCGAEM